MTFPWDPITVAFVALPLTVLVLMVASMREPKPR